MWWRRAVSREAVVCAALAATVGGLLAWLGPTGTDFAAHAYQRALFLRHGFTLWDDFWYAGRYSFVDYSVLYYPLAVLLGIRMLAVGDGCGRGIRVRGRGGPGVGSGRALVESQLRGRVGRLPDLGGISLCARDRTRSAGAVGVAVGSPLALRRADPAHAGREPSRARAARRRGGRRRGRAPRHVRGGRPCRRSHSSPRSRPSSCCCGSSREQAAIRSPPRRRGWRLVSASSASLARGGSRARASCGISSRRTRWRSRRLPGAVGPRGEHHEASLRRGAPGVAHRRAPPLATAAARAAVVCAAFAWNARHSRRACRTPSPMSSAHSVWRAPLAYLHAHLRPGYRVEAVDTAEHWPAFYLAESGIPLVRGWFRQDDFPLDAPLYRHLTPVGYQRWLRKLGVAYVVLTRSPPDYSSRGEASTGAQWPGRAPPRLGVAGGSDLQRATAATHPHRAWPADRAGAARVAPRSSASHAAARTASLSTGRPTGTHPPAALHRPPRDAPASTRAATRVRIAFDVDPTAFSSALAGAAPTCPSEGVPTKTS